MNEAPIFPNPLSKSKCYYFTYRTNTDLKNPTDKSRYSTDLLLSWVVANRFTSYKVLQKLTGYHEKSVYKIVKRLIDKGLLTTYKNFGCIETLITTTREGKAYYRVFWSEEIPVWSVNKLSSMGNVNHCLQAQLGVVATIRFFEKKFVIHRLRLYTEPKVGFVNPDCVLQIFMVGIDGNQEFNSNIAIESECSKKNKVRTHFQMQNHHTNISVNNEYSMVFYYCNSETVCNYYKKKLTEEWITYKKARGKITSKIRKFKKEEGYAKLMYIKLID